MRAGLLDGIRAKKVVPQWCRQCLSGWEVLVPPLTLYELLEGTPLSPRFSLYR